MTVLRPRVGGLWRGNFFWLGPLGFTTAITQCLDLSLRFFLLCFELNCIPLFFVK